MSASERALSIELQRPLAPLTTLQLGGPATHFVDAHTRETLRAALTHAEREGLRVGLLGGGSNLVIADAGFEGLVIRLQTRGMALTRSGSEARLTVQAGEPWDGVVQRAIDEDLAGIECLTGIPGSTGAVPIQNVGAYGQEVSDVIEAVEVFDRQLGISTWLSAAECAFSYRDSRFKREPARFVVLAVRLLLRAHGAASVRYGELSRALGSATPTLRDVQREVRALRASKGMLIDASYEPSAGSFFTNPLVDAAVATRVAESAAARGLLVSADELPRHPAPHGQVKLSAGWLIEHAGIHKGTQRGAVGVSARHALALVHFGGGSTADLMALATEIQQQVDNIFGVQLQLEPVRWG